MQKGQPVESCPFNFGAGKRSRTPDLRITNALLYQLSYAGNILATHRSDYLQAFFPF